MRATDCIIITPHRLAGEPTIGHSRLGAAFIASVADVWGDAETLRNYDLTATDLALCRWFVAAFRVQRRRGWARATDDYDAAAAAAAAADEPPWGDGAVRFATEDA